MMPVTKECMICFERKQVFWGHLGDYALRAFKVSELAESAKDQNFHNKMHGVCSACLPSIDKCPTCRQNYTNRDSVVEYLRLSPLDILPSDEFLVKEYDKQEEAIPPPGAAPAAQPAPLPLRDAPVPHGRVEFPDVRLGAGLEERIPAPNFFPPRPAPARRPMSPQVPLGVRIAQCTMGLVCVAAIIGGLFFVCIMLQNSSLGRSLRDPLRSFTNALARTKDVVLSGLGSGVTQAQAGLLSCAERIERNNPVVVGALKSTARSIYHIAVALLS